MFASRSPLRRLLPILGLVLAAGLAPGCASSSGPSVAIAALADRETVAGWQTYLVLPDEDADLNAFGRAVRQHLEDAGHRVVTSANQPWDVYVTYGYDFRSWRETSTSPRYRHSYNGISWTTGGLTSVNYYTDVNAHVGFIEWAEILRLDGDPRLADVAWKGSYGSRIGGQGFRIVDHAPGIVGEILTEFIAWKRPPAPEPGTEEADDPDVVAAGS